MSENPEKYLRDCREQNICPTCQKNIIKKQGIFCSWDCEVKWNSGEIIHRQLKILKKERPDG